MNDIRKIVDFALDNSLFTGISVEIGNIDGDKFRCCAGYNRNSNEIKIDESTIFDMASVTKIFTSTIILRLISKDLIKLNTKVIALLDELRPFSSKILRDITIGDLLTHNSGIHYWYPFYTEKGRDFYEILEKVFIENDKLIPGTYSDINFILLGKIIEKILGDSLDRVLIRELVDPLGMEKTTYLPNKKEIFAATEYGNRIEMEMVKKIDLNFDAFRDIDKEIYGEVNDGNSFYYFDGVSGHAGIFSNIRDLRKLVMLYLKEGIHNEQEFIKAELIKTSKEDYGNSRGLGWVLDGIFKQGYGHTGFTGTSIYINDSLGFYVNILTNRLNVEKPVNINDFRMDIHQEVLKKYKNKEKWL